jgi:anti-sigma-K factor RskA
MTAERDLQAGEYVLGTLTAEERAAFEHELRSDPQLGAAVRDWEARLRPLADGVAEVQPSAQVWPAIEGKLGAPGAAVADLGLERIRRSVRLWRAAALGASALAASLALVIGLDRGRAPRSDDQYVAVVNRGGELPALLVRVDTGSGTIHVRSLAAETPADRSLELWYIGPGRPPRSLGLVDSPTRRVAIPASTEDRALEGATVAVTAEPKGGSPTGDPTGPVVYSGKLVKDDP